MGGGGVIIGGGIAGLTAAIAMQRCGIPVEIYESAQEIKPVGAGIWMAPNAMQVFHRLGLANAINKAGVPLNKIQVVDRLFRPIMRTNQAYIKDKFGYTTTAIRRSELQELLLHTVGTGNVRLSKTCVKLRENKDGTEVIFADGTAIHASFVIGADGIHSVVRRHLFPEAPFNESAYVVWRGISEIQLLPWCKKAILEAWHGGLRFGFSEVGDGVVDWFAVLKQSANPLDSAPKQALTQTFKDFSYPVPAILACADERRLIKNIIADQPTLSHWHRGNICVIGDAAHASTPYMGQGGCQAVEDAYVLAQCLQREPHIQTAFQTLQKIRSAKANYIVRASRMMGSIGYLSQVAGALRNVLIRATPQFMIENQFVKVYSLNY